MITKTKEYNDNKNNDYSPINIFKLSCSTNFSTIGTFCF